MNYFSLALKTIMDCAICYAPITSATGKLDLACSHSFHINCLASWFETLNKTQRTQECPYCRHECSELEMIPTPSEQYRLHSEITEIHNVVEATLREEVHLLREGIRIANEQRDLAFEDATEAEEIARNIHRELHQYKLEQNARNIVEKKQQIKNNWAKWTGSLKK